MKLFQVLILLVLSANAFAQTSSNLQNTGDDSAAAKQSATTPGTVFTYVEQMPEPTFNVSTFIKENVHYPEEANLNGNEGKVFVKFIVNADGEVENAVVAKGVCASLDSESLRVVRLMPKWKPGMQNGKAEAVYYTLPIVFSLVHSDWLSPLNTPKSDKKVYVDEAPKPGYDLGKFVESTMRYPQDGKTFGISGEVRVRFQVLESGKIMEPQVVGTVYPSLDAEAVRIAKSFPDWRPAIKDGKAFGVYYYATIKFSTGPPMSGDSTLDYKNVAFPEPTFNVSFYLRNTTKYPYNARENNISGTSIVRFIVDVDGSIIGVHTPHPIYIELDNEAKRVVREMPKWKPATLNGKPIRFIYTLPIGFRLE